MSFDARTAIEALLSRLREVGSPDRAEGEKRYLRSNLVFLGATVAQTRREVRAIAAAHAALSHDELTTFVRALWSCPVFDARLAAVMALQAYPEQIGPRDLELLRQLICTAHTWALVDPLAGDVLGSLLLRHPDAADALDAWATDPDFWARRAALLAQMGPLKHGASFERFARYADAMLEEREFFIRKAIGWVLRETAKRDPDIVYQWLAPRISRASGVTVREAVKYLDVARRDQLLLAYRTQRGRPVGAPARSRR
jgi:3-methyladenine DNA glycosylase AlkD